MFPNIWEVMHLEINITIKQNHYSLVQNDLLPIQNYFSLIKIPLQTYSLHMGFM